MSLKTDKYTSYWLSTRLPVAASAVLVDVVALERGCSGHSCRLSCVAAVLPCPGWDSRVRVTDY